MEDERENETPLDEQWVAFGRMVAARRDELRLTQQACADKADIDRQTWYRIESGQSTRRETVLKMAEVLGEPPGKYLLASGLAIAIEPSLNWSSDIFDRARIERILQNYDDLTQEEREEIAPYLAAIEMNVARRAQRRKK